MNYILPEPNEIKIYEDDKSEPIGMDVVCRIRCGLAKLDKKIIDDVRINTGWAKQYEIK